MITKKKVRAPLSPEIRRSNAKKKEKARFVLLQTGMYLVLVLFALLILIPFIFAVSTSFTSPENIFDFKWIPSPVDIGNYDKLFSENNVWGAFLNTFLYTVPTTIIGTFCSALCAYSCARMKWPGRRIVYYLILATMVIPGVITLMPSYVLFVNFYRWYGTPLPIIIPGMFGSAGAMFFLHQYFKTLPKELEEAAEIDGTGRLRIFLTIILPLSIPAVLTQFILAFNGAYNDYMTPLLYVGTNPDLFTIQLLVSGLSTSHNKQYTLLMAGAITALVPTFVLYVACQRFFVDGIAMTGLKE